MVKEQPQKIPNVSILVLICNAKNFLVSKFVVEYFHAQAQQLLDTIRAKDVSMDEAEPATAPENEENPAAESAQKRLLSLKMQACLMTSSPFLSSWQHYRLLLRMEQ